MSPALNAAGNGKMDWFFNQWISGVEIPRFSANLQVTKIARGEYRITGQVSVSEVSEGFRVLVPVYARLNQHRSAMLGRLPFIGSDTRQIDLRVKLPAKPKDVLVNAGLEVLARDGGPL